MSRHPCPICRVMCSVEHDFFDYQLCLCKNCEHRFSIVPKTNEESYGSASQPRIMARHAGLKSGEFLEAVRIV